MSATDFDDARLERPDTLDNPWLRHLAGTGARIRREALFEPSGQMEPGLRPRGIIAIGAEARLIRAVMEPVCPVPFVAWPNYGLPGWVGPLDLVIFLGSEGSDRPMLAAAREANRRGASLLVAAPAASELAEISASRSTLTLPTTAQDPLAAAVAVLSVLGRLELGPAVVPDHVAEAADLVAESCSPRRDLSINPAKELALGLADTQPLVWGGTVLAARASRRIAEALRRASGRPALAADADALEPLLASVVESDPFADPFEEAPLDRQPALVVCEDQQSNQLVRTQQTSLIALAESVGVRVCRITSGAEELPGSEVDRYATLLQSGLYGAAYLGIGLGRAG